MVTNKQPTHPRWGDPRAKTGKALPVSGEAIPRKCCHTPVLYSLAPLVEEQG